MSDIKPEAQLDSTRATLRRRARELARPLQSDQALEEAFQLVEFKLAHERYAFEQKWVREVQPLKDLTPLPGTPPFLRGIVNLRGQIYPVIDIKKFFDLPDQGITDLHVILIVCVAEIEVGVLADAIGDVVSLPLSRLQGALPTQTGIRAEYLKGVTEDRLVVLDAQRMLNDPKLIINEEPD